MLGTPKQGVAGSIPAGGTQDPSEIAVRDDDPLLTTQVCTGSVYRLVIRASGVACCAAIVGQIYLVRERGPERTRQLGRRRRRL